MSISNILRIAATVVVLAGLNLSLTACNTTEGFGKDVKNTGSAIQNSAKQNGAQ